MTSGADVLLVPDVLVDGGGELLVGGGSDVGGGVVGVLVGGGSDVGGGVLGVEGEGGGLVGGGSSLVGPGDRKSVV